MPKLVLKVSDSVPELPAAVRKEKGLTVRRVSKLSAGAGEQQRHRRLAPRPRFHRRATAPCWKRRPCARVPPPVEPRRKARQGTAEIPDELVFDEVFSFKNPAYFQRTLRNLFRRLHLERELAIKDALLRAKEAENSELLKVGIALSAERDNDKLLDDILRQLRQIARADAGTLYLLERDEASGEQKLRFKITQNDSNPQDYSEFVMPLSKKTISGYVASTGTVLNIEDAYRDPRGPEYGFNPQRRQVHRLSLQEHAHRAHAGPQGRDPRGDPAHQLQDGQRPADHVTGGRRPLRGALQPRHRARRALPGLPGGGLPGEQQALPGDRDPLRRLRQGVGAGNRVPGPHHVGPFQQGGGLHGLPRARRWTGWAAARTGTPTSPRST